MSLSCARQHRRFCEAQQYTLAGFGSFGHFSLYLLSNHLKKALTVYSRIRIEHPCKLWISFRDVSKPVFSNFLELSMEAASSADGSQLNSILELTQSQGVVKQATHHFSALKESWNVLEE